MLIDISAGSGGKATKDLIDSVFARHFNGASLRRAEDAAVLSVEGGKLAFTTDSYVVDPLFFRGGDIGKLAICGTVNDLAVMGARPKYLSAGFIIQTGMDTETLEKIAVSMAEAAAESGIELAACDTKVVEGRGGIYINTSGIGEIPAGRETGTDLIREGHAIIVSGTLGDHHACILSSRMGIENDIASDVRPLAKPIEALFAGGVRPACMRDITRGGLGTIINELADGAGLQALLREPALQVDRTVRGLCDILGLDPVYMGNEGKFALVLPQEDAEKALGILRRFEYTKDACVVGVMRQGRGAVLETALGGQRKIGLLLGEGLPRIC